MGAASSLNFACERLLWSGDAQSIRILRTLAPASYLRDLCTEKTRKTFYQVTGQSPMPEKPWSQKRADLTVQRSSLEGWVDSDAALGYLEWTFEAHNSKGWDQEGWLKLHLPPGAAVSRASLWVNGRPQEAVFSSTGKARSAYQAVTAARRDPLLVTPVGPARVELRFSPIPAHKSMKVRVGITLSLQLSSREQARLAFPQWCDLNLRCGAGGCAPWCARVWPRCLWWFSPTAGAPRRCIVSAWFRTLLLGCTRGWGSWFSRF